MQINRKRLILSFLLNLIMMFLFISSIIIEIVNIYKNPNSIYINVWGIFRYFTIDGNIMSFIFTSIIAIKQFLALKMSINENIKSLIISQFLFKISLMSACTDLVIFVVVVFIFIPMSINNVDFIINLVGTYHASCLHVTIPILLNLRFIFLDVRERDFKFYEKFYGGIPMTIYGVIMYILCASKVFLSFSKEIKDGDGKIPYPFFDIYHESWYFCTFIGLLIFLFGFGIGILLDFLNKKFGNKIFPYDINSEIDKDENDINTGIMESE